MDPQQLQIVLGQLAHAFGMPPPPPLTPDQVASGSSLMSQLLATLGLAGNAGDPTAIRSLASNMYIKTIVKVLNSSTMVIEVKNNRGINERPRPIRIAEPRISVRHQQSRERQHV